MNADCSRATPDPGAAWGRRLARYAAALAVLCTSALAAATAPDVARSAPAAVSPAAAPAAAGRSVTLPLPDLATIDGNVAELVRARHAAAAEALGAGENAAAADALAELAIAFEANDLWAPAARTWHRALSMAGDAAPTADWRFHEAVSRREAGDVARATELLQALARDEPTLPWVQQRLGEALAEQGHFDAAAAAYARLVELAPDAPHGHVGLGGVYLAQQRWAGAVSALERAAAIAPDYRQARYMLGLAYRATGRREAALEELRRGVDAVPAYLPDPLAESLARATVNVPARRHLAASLLAAGRPDQAGRVLEQIVFGGTADLADVNNLAVAYLQQNRLDEAENLLRQSAAAAPTNFGTQLNLVSLAERRGDLDTAREHAVRAVALAPRVARTHQALARIQARGGDWTAAEASLAEAQRLEARDPQLAAMHGDVLARLGRYPEAAERFQRAVALYPDFLPALLALSRLALQADDLTEARAWQRRAAAVAPEHPAVRRLTQAVADAAAGDTADTAPRDTVRNATTPEGSRP